jgi:hypothetical protein
VFSLSGRCLLAVAAVTVAGTEFATVERGHSQIINRPCGHERWNVKTLLDPAAPRINYTPRPTTVNRLLALPRPRSVGSQTPRLAPVEFRTYSLHTPVVAARRIQSFDTLLVIGRPGHMMLVVFQDTHTCLDQTVGPKGGEIHDATDQFNADCGPAIPYDHWQRLSGAADITGVSFFDVRHATPIVGAAPNGIQLHPALNFSAPKCRQVDG